MAIQCFTCKNFLKRTEKDGFVCKNPEFKSDVKPVPYCVLKEQLEAHGQWLNILVAGSKGSGKTYYILSLIQDLVSQKNGETLRVLGSLGLSFEFQNDDSEQKFKEFYKDIVRGEVIPGTNIADSKDWNTPFILKVRHRRREKTLIKFLAFYNLPGEFFEENNNTRMDAFGQIQTASGVIYIHDPVRDSGLFEYVKINHGEYEKYHNHDHVENQIIQRLGATLNPRKDFDTNNRASAIAVCISKFDLIEPHLRDRIFDSGYIPSNKLITRHGKVNKAYFYMSMEGLKEVFKKSDLKPDFQYLSSKPDFQKYGTFAIAPIGHDHPSIHPPTPKGVLAPFFWLLTFFLDI